MNSAAPTSEYQMGEHNLSFLDNFCRSTLFKMIKNIKHGKILVRQNSKTWTFGTDETLKVNIVVSDPAFYRRCLFGGSIGSGEAYVEGMWKVDNLTNLVRIMVLNMALLDRMEVGLAWFLKPVDLLKHFFNQNSKNGAKQNILAHYDLGKDLYKSFLDPTMMYSSAIYPTAESSLEEASAHKLEIVCKKLCLKEGDEILEIGSGWGGFAIYAARNYGCQVTTTTISNAQYKEARKRIHAAGLEDQITLLKKDYRDLEGQYDKLVSIEMIEAVGHKYLPKFFKKCGKLLKPDGKMLIQAITIVDQKYDQYARSVDFIQRHIFPGGCLPSNNRMLNLINAKTDMVVRSIEDFGFDYAKTIQEWRHRFSQASASLKTKGYDDSFDRLWEFYLCYCEGGFLERSISVVHLVASRPENRD